MRDKGNQQKFVDDMGTVVTGAVRLAELIDKKADDCVCVSFLLLSYTPVLRLPSLSVFPSFFSCLIYCWPAF
ncbi:hypothetical protein M1146_06035 [Patescibacteria group bacterium]|nr:hypothetical protein [Patescibacteria group bacterium]